jgi:RHS repeat-associated protein
VFFDNFGIQSLPSTTVQVTHYYPFGMEMPALSYQAPAMNKNRYLYNGKEKIEEIGWLDYGARMYDPAIGRWGVADPLADKYFSFSPSGRSMAEALGVSGARRRYYHLKQENF